MHTHTPLGPQVASPLRYCQPQQEETDRARVCVGGGGLGGGRGRWEAFRTTRRRRFRQTCCQRGDGADGVDGCRSDALAIAFSASPSRNTPAVGGVGGGGWRTRKPAVDAVAM